MTIKQEKGLTLLTDNPFLLTLSPRKRVDNPQKIFANFIGLVGLIGLFLTQTKKMAVIISQ